MIIAKLDHHGEYLQVKRLTKICLLPIYLRLLGHSRPGYFLLWLMVGELHADDRGDKPLGLQLEIMKITASQIINKHRQISSTDLFYYYSITTA